MNNCWIIKGYVAEKSTQRIILKIVGIALIILSIALIPIAIKNIGFVIAIPICLAFAYIFLIDKKIKFDENGIWLMRKKYVAWKDVYKFSYENNIISMTLKSPKDGETITVNAGVAGKKHIEKLPQIMGLYNVKK